MEMTLPLKREHAGGISVSSEEHISNIIPIEAWDEKTGIFYGSDKRISFCWQCQPLSGMTGSNMHEQVSSMLKVEFPNESILSITLFKSSDVLPFTAAMRRIRKGSKAMNEPLYRGFIGAQVDKLKENAYRPMKLAGRNVKIADQRIIISVRIPINSHTPTEKEIERALEQKENFVASMKANYLQPQELTAPEYIRLMQSFVNWSPTASWRRSADPQYDPDVLINHQVFDIDNEMEVSRVGLRLGDQYIKVLGTKKYPSAAYMGDAAHYIGSVIDASVTISDHFAITTNIFYCDPYKVRADIQRKQTNVTNQLKGGLAIFMPDLKKTKEDLDRVAEDIKRHRAIQVSTQVVVFSDTESSAKHTAKQFEDLWSARDWSLKTETTIPYPAFVNTLPMCADGAAVKTLFRYKTLTSAQAAVLVPIFGDWRGTHDYPTVNFLSRNGQPIGFDLRKMGSPAPHFLVTATTGGGKSFLMNHMLLSYSSMDAQSWIIDVGRSYEKICDVVGGTFTEFGKKSQISLNPFTLVDERDPDEDLAMIADLLHTMAADNERPLTNLQTSQLKTATKVIFNRHGTLSTIDHISDYLREDSDHSIVQLGRQLEQWTSTGIYGKWFEGPNNASFKDVMNVIELEELKGQKALQRAVLLALINTIQREVYMGERNRLKIIVIDEAWDLLNSPMVASFIEGMYRRARKYGGIIGIITQTLNELTVTSTGKAIIANAPNKIMLKQNPDAIAMMRQEKKTDISDWELNLLKTVTMVKGEYSELLLKTEMGTGVARFIAGPKEQLLYSTDHEEVQAINNLRRQGMDVMEAIEHLLEQRKRGANDLEDAR